jgi:hypothetical protein
LLLKGQAPEAREISPGMAIRIHKKEDRAAEKPADLLEPSRT